VDVVIPTYMTCVKHTNPKFWSSVVVSEELEKYISKKFSNINAMDQLVWVQGERGSGKSQVLEVVARSCIEEYQNWQILPLIVSVSGISDGATPEDVSKKVCQSIATALVYCPDTFEEAANNVGSELSGDGSEGWDVTKFFPSLREAQETFDETKFSTIERLETLLRQVGQRKISYILLIDELDKIAPFMYYEFLVRNQSLFSRLFELDAKMMVSIVPESLDLINNRSSTDEANYYKARSITPPEIYTPRDCIKMIDGRIKMRSPDWVSPFDSQCYQIIMRKCHGIPRDILRETGYIIEEAANRDLNKIPHEFVIKYFEQKKSSEVFSAFLSDIISTENERSNLLFRIQNELHSRVLQAFYFNPISAKTGDYSALQLSGLINLDQANYKLTVTEMIHNGVLDDKGYGPSINEKLKVLLDSIHEEWGVNPIEVFATIDQLRSKKPARSSRVDYIDRVPRARTLDNSIIDIISKNQFLTYKEIRLDLERYETGKNLENWKTALSVRLSALVRNDLVSRVESEPTLYYTGTPPMSLECATDIGDGEVIKQLLRMKKIAVEADEGTAKSIPRLMVSFLYRTAFDREVPKGARINQMLKEISKVYEGSKRKRYTKVIKDAISLKNLSLLAETVIQATAFVRRVKRDRISEASTIISHVRNYIDTPLTMMDPTSIPPAVIEAVYTNAEKNLLLRVFNERLVKSEKDGNLEEASGVDRGNLFSCECGMKCFSDNDKVVHYGCEEGSKEMENQGPHYYISNASHCQFTIIRSLRDQASKRGMIEKDGNEFSIISSGHICGYAVRNKKGYHLYLAGQSIGAIPNMKEPKATITIQGAFRK